MLDRDLGTAREEKLSFNVFPLTRSQSPLRTASVDSVYMTSTALSAALDL